MNNNLDKLEIVHSQNGVILNSIHFNGNTGFAVGNNGTVLQYNNKTEKWESKTINSISVNLNSVFFIDKNHGWIVGDKTNFNGQNEGTILKTTDGGNTWVQKQARVNSNLSKVIFTNKNVGYAIGDAGGITKTTDGGKTWNCPNANTIHNTAGSNIHLKNIWMDGSKGYIIGSEKFMCGTEDGWHDYNILLQNPDIMLNDFYFHSKNSGFIIGGRGYIYKYSKKGNEPFERISIGIEMSLNGIVFIDDKVGYIVGEKGLILKTDNGGDNWTVFKKSEGSSPNYTCIFYDKNTKTLWLTDTYGNISKIKR